MRKIHIYFLFLFYFICSISCNKNDIEDIEKYVSVIPPEYQLVWQDEFNEMPNRDGSLPLPNDEWVSFVGKSYNEEAQYFVDRIFGKDTVAKIKNGSLIITAFKLDSPYEGYDYISSRMSTNTSWKYGYFEMRAKLTKGIGSWPAFWMVSKDRGSAGGEIDIMEYVGYMPNTIWATVHAKRNMLNSNAIYTPDVENKFHVYALEWTTDEIKMFVNGEQYFSYKNDYDENEETWSYFDEFYIILNLSIGGGWGGVQGIDPKIFPAHYEIDYVRVYQKTENK
jgi:beta-glucanase (GH16 family)